MTQYHPKDLKKPSGGMRRASHKKKIYEGGGIWCETKLLTAEDNKGEKRKATKTKGLCMKSKLYSTGIANIINPKTGKAERTKILEVVDHPDNPHFTRQMLITKGCTLKTGLGLARVTSRPGQHGVVNCVLLKAATQ